MSNAAAIRPNTRRRRPSHRRTHLWVLLATVTIASCTDGTIADEPVDISDAREELLALVIDIAGADGHRYDVHDDEGHTLDAAEIIELPEAGGFAAVYHWWDETETTFVSSLATSDDLLNWDWEVDLAVGASQPTIAPATDGGFVVAWEEDVDPRVTASYYPTWDALLAGRYDKSTTAERTMSECAEGTPNIYAASSDEVDLGLHFYAGCQTDRQARATTDWETWNVESQPLLDRAALFQGYRGSIGDRDIIEFEGHLFTFLEAQFIQDDWRTFRILLYDEDLGAADAAGFPSAPAVPPSVHAFLYTHAGSSSFTNFTATEVTLDGRRALVMAVFIPEEGALGDEAGELIYYRFIEAGRSG